MLEFGKQNQNVETYVVKPAGVLAKDRCAALGYVFPTVWVDELAAAMADLAVNGGNNQMVLNKAIIEKGRELLNKQNGQAHE